MSDCQKKPIICLHKDCSKMGMATAPAGKAPPPRDSARNVKKQLLRQSAVGTLSARGTSMMQTAFSSKAVEIGAAQMAADSREALEVDAAQLTEFLSTSSETDIYSLRSGDVFSIRTLYAMAGRNLDDEWHSPEKNKTLTTRKRGTVLVVNIHYNNLKPWTLYNTMDPPEYVISVTSRPVEKYKQIMAVESSNKARELRVAYGTLLIVQSSGTIGVFRMIHMLIVVSTSLGLLAAASAVTDILALYVLPMRDEYNKAKFQDTEDFHDLYLKREEEETTANAPPASPQ